MEKFVDFIFVSNTGNSENLNRFGFGAQEGAAHPLAMFFFSFSTVYIIDKFVVGKTEKYLGFLCPNLLRSQGTAKNRFKVAGAARAVDVAALLQGPAWGQ
jgi:hypothetical protein